MVRVIDGEVVASSRRPNGLDVTQVRVPLGVVNRLGHDLEAPDLARPARHRQADRADAAEEVEDPLGPGQPGELRRHPVEPLGHLGVGLEERLGGDADRQTAELLLIALDTRQQLCLAAGGGLGDAVEPGPQQTVGGGYGLGERIAIELAA